MNFSGSGLTWYGGFIGGTIGVLLVAKMRKIPILLLCDISAPILGLGYAIGRMGCFLNGDDYGRPSDAPWAMAFPKGTPPTLTKVHPTQIYEVIAGILMFLILNRLKDRIRKPGALFGLYLVLAGLERFSVEFYRTNEPWLAGLTFAQWISIALMLTGAIMFTRPVRDGRPAETVPA
jgi:phosphatidylglycerol:prolipoprotein diacylglycerol transferase